MAALATMCPRLLAKVTIATGNDLEDNSSACTLHYVQLLDGRHLEHGRERRDLHKVAELLRHLRKHEQSSETVFIFSETGGQIMKIPMQTL